MPPSFIDVASFSEKKYNSSIRLIRVTLLVRAIPIFTTESSTVIMIRLKIVILTMSSKRVKPWLFIFFENLMMIVNERIEIQKERRVPYRWWLQLDIFSMILVRWSWYGARDSRLFHFQIIFFREIKLKYFLKIFSRYRWIRLRKWECYFVMNGA